MSREPSELDDRYGRNDQQKLMLHQAAALCPYSNATRGNVDVTLCVDGTHSGPKGFSRVQIREDGE